MLSLASDKHTTLDPGHHNHTAMKRKDIKQQAEKDVEDFIRELHKEPDPIKRQRAFEEHYRAVEALRYALKNAVKK